MNGAAKSSVEWLPYVMLTHFLFNSRSQMAVCVINVIKLDFPGRWVGIVDKVVLYLQTPNTNDSWLGALLALYQLVKNYE